MFTRFLIAGTLAGGLVLSVLNWFTAAILPPRYQQFTHPQAVVEAVGLRLASQLVAECAVALGLSLLLLATPLRSSAYSAGVLGLAGLIAGVETHFPNWNWAGFPTSYLLAGSAYLAGNWFVAGLLLGAIRRRLEAKGVAG